jgi:hypothetical protein
MGRVKSRRAVPLMAAFLNRSSIGIKPPPLLFEELLQGLFRISHDVFSFSIPAARASHPRGAPLVVAGRW